MRNRNIAVVTIVLIIQLTGCNVPSDAGHAQPSVEVVSVEDLGVVNQDSRLRGRDGGYSGMVGDRQVWVFGDSVISEPNSQGKTWLGSSFSFNPYFESDPRSPSLPLSNDLAGLPIELIDYTTAEEQYNQAHQGDACTAQCGSRWALWPGPVVADSARDRSILFYGKIHSSPGELNFYGVGHSIAFWQHGANKPTRIIQSIVPDHPTLLFGDKEPQFGHGAFAHGETLFVYACERVETVKPCRLARAPLADVANKESWEYFGYENKWVDGYSSLQPLFHGNDIISVSYNAYLDRFTAVYSEPLSRNIQIRTAPRPEGPWSRPVKITTALPSQNTNGWVYDGLAHAEMSEEDGRFVYITYTRDSGTGTREMRMLRVELAPV